ncbi:hypothetical protein CONPUDRAFT_137854 [Coniophora puteana RWD-64-598 SS2]|uniref:RNI-like protein n=1 Tax=Coniophora puteana (strain RWD-64-598) TaxID=741705 RepID=A0A5M3MLG3_CONPW|nr:uncharacterized protein CONPUDRAFT_137854 [Coniophora puteana RWD-64-598 SS2]EIW79515.1 hypothetical protein CONPUDRAFT_137854 [Coniophora puteana RWD-64-598 SS2]
MHACLRIPELTTLICSLVVEGDNLQSPLSGGRRRSANICLFALARTCKVLKDPALDALYRDIFCLGDMLRCLPSDLWKIEAKEESGYRERPWRTFSFNRAMSRSDWHVLENYTPRVRTLDINGLSDTTILADGVLDGILSHCGATLFPHIRALHVSFSIKESYLPLFSQWYLGPSLRDLSLGSSSTSSTAVLISFIDAAIQSSQCLQSLTFPHSVPDDRLLELLSLAARRLPQLKSLSIPLRGSNESIFTAVGTIRSLNSLTLLPGYYYRQPTLRASPRALSLPNLTRLHFHGGWEGVGSIIKDMPIMETIQFVSVSLSSIGQAVNAKRVLESLSTKVPETLQGIDITIWGCRSLAMTDNFLERLGKLRQLTSFSLRSDSEKHYTDRHLQFLAQTFPSLTRLRLESSCDFPTATLRGVAHLLRGCPQLKDLSLAIDATVSAEARCKKSAVDAHSTAMAS